MSRQEELIQRSQSGDREATELLVEENSGLIWSVVRRFMGRGAEADDLYQLGCLGFLKAVRGFDPAYGTQFSTYAVPKIAGEIRRFLRDDGPVKVSRGLKEQGACVRGARAQLAARLGREPTLSELGEETGLTPEEIAVAETAADPVISLQTETGDGGLTVEGMLTAGGEEEGLVERLGEIRWQERPLEVQCSVGVCICPQPQYTYQQLYAETDRMLYRAKETGRGRCCVRQLDCGKTEASEAEQG